MSPFESQVNYKDIGNQEMIMARIGESKSLIMEYDKIPLPLTTFCRPCVKYKCSFKQCKERVWFDGFETADELHLHMVFHRCQWIHMSQHCKPCLYVPKDDDDLRCHLEKHLARDHLPQGRTQNDTRVLYFCPWQTCTSASYCVRGISNKAHMSEHIRKHCPV